MSVKQQRFKCDSIKIKLELVSSKDPHESPFVYLDDILTAFKIQEQDVDRFEAKGGHIVYVRDHLGNR